MNFYYLDSSALVKRYYREKGTEFMQHLFDTAVLIAASSLALVEVVATLARIFFVVSDKELKEVAADQEFNVIDPEEAN